MAANERRQFARQLRLMREIADLVSVSDALEMLRSQRSGNYCICLTFDDARLGAFENAMPILVEQGVPATFFVVPGWIDDRLSGTFSWDDCRSLVAAGMEVGSHSLNHRRLANMTRSEVVSELTRSRLRIEAELNRSCVHFACPWGQPGEDFRPERDPALARLSGFRSFLTSVPRRAAMGVSPYNIPRVRMEPAWGAAELRYALLR